MNTQNHNDARPSGQDAAGSAKEQLHALVVKEMENCLSELKRTDQPWRSVPAKVDVPCEFHVFLPKAGTMLEPATGVLRTFIWDPCTDRPLGRESFVVPQWQVGEPFQLLNVEGKKTLLLTGEVSGTHIEVPEEPLEWMPNPTAELQSVYGSGFMTFDPRDFFMGHVDHAYGGMHLEPHLPGDWTLCNWSAMLGDLAPFRHGLVVLSMKGGANGRGERKNLEALARVGLVQKYRMGLATVFSAKPIHAGRMGDRTPRPRLIAVFPGQQ